MKSKDIQTFVSNYAALIQYILQLRHGSLHATIMDDVAEFHPKGYSEHKSIMMALNKNRHLIDGIWEEDDDSAMESEEYDDSETEESKAMIQRKRTEIIKSNYLPLLYLKCRMNNKKKCVDRSRD